MLVDDVQILINTRLEDIENSSLVILMLKVYTKLYNDPNTIHILGSSCKNCKQKLIKIYKQLKLNGMELAEKFDKPRTCIPAWNGLRYISGAAKHYDSSNLTDEAAIFFLEKNILSESDFKKLPEGYSVKKEVNNNIDIKGKSTILAPKKTTKKIVSKKKK